MKKTNTCLAFTLFFTLLGGSLSALTREEAVWFLNRAGLGPTEPEIQELSPLDRTQAVDLFLKLAKSSSGATPVTWRNDPPFPKPPQGADATVIEAAKRERQKIDRDHFHEFTSVWVKELLTSEAPLRERLTLFWHNHFTTSYETVNSAVAMVHQHELLRSSVLGNFRDLVRRITVDPAMMVYLDTRSNKKAKPNENYAREFLELFTLGEGNYTEADIQDAARALSGLGFDGQTGALRIDFRQHDDGEKTLFGNKGNWNWENLIELTLKQDAAARFIPQKLWEEFVNEDPSDQQIDGLAQIFKNSGWEIAPVVRAILLSPEFWDLSAPTRVKSPAEFLVSSVRAYPVGLTTDRLSNLLRRMHQPLDEPLSVKGWPVGSEWITADSLNVRRQVAGEMVNSLKKYSGLDKPTLAAASKVLLSDDWEFK